VDEDQMKIVVCGDSICSATTNPSFYGHFSDLLAEQGHEIINLARGGATNTTICFQLKTAIDLKASLVIFGRTDSGRIDIPIKPFDIRKGLKNFIYPYSSDSSFGSPFVGGSNANILSETTGGITQRTDINLTISEEIKTAVKYYVSYLQDQKLNEFKEYWMIEHWIHQLEKANIPYIEITKTSVGKEIWDYIDNNPTLIHQCVYHTDKQSQQMVANSILQKIEELELNRSH
jgi:hypothetical protein